MAKTIIDFGASHHMFKRQESFRTLSSRMSLVTGTGENSSLKSTNVRTVNIKLDAGASNIKLRNVLHVPSLHHNLLSVRALTKDGNDVLFKQSGEVKLIQSNNLHGDSLIHGDKQLLHGDKNSLKIGEAVGDLYELKACTFNAEKSEKYSETTKSDAVNDTVINNNYTL